MDIDQQHCPHCGHGVLNWGLACPGCNAIPWDTAEAQRLLSQLAWRQRVRTAAWIAAALAAYAGFVMALQAYGRRFGTMREDPAPQRSPQR